MGVVRSAKWAIDAALDQAMRRITYNNGFEAGLNGQPRPVYSDAERESLAKDGFEAGVTERRLRVDAVASAVAASSVAAPLIVTPVDRQLPVIEAEALAGDVAIRVRIDGERMKMAVQRGSRRAAGSRTIDADWDHERLEQEKEALQDELIRLLEEEWD